MGNIPVTDQSMAHMNVLKAKSMMARNGKSFTWSDLQAALLKTAMEHENEFLEYMKRVDPITRPGAGRKSAEQVNREITEGKRVTDDDIKQDFSASKE